jgi:hypothetical protein
MSLELFLERMEHIVRVERRPFSHRDFLSFDHKGKSYRFSDGTIRNYFSILRKQDKIDIVYKTTNAFYTLKGVKVGKTMTPDHTGGSNITTGTLSATSTRKRGASVANPSNALNYKQHRFLQFLLNIPMDIDGVHNVRLKFTAKGLWEILPLYNDFKYLIKKVDTLHNKDIVLYDMNFGDHTIKATVHRSDTVSVIVSCSKTPIPIDIVGLAKLTCSLAHLQNRLQSVVDEYLRNTLRSNKRSDSLITKGPIPSCMTWIATMWHFGRDSLTTYNGEMFEISWADALGLFRVYSKEFKNKTRIRKELQEYPRRPWSEVFMERLPGFDIIEKPLRFSNSNRSLVGGQIA